MKRGQELFRNGHLLASLVHFNHFANSEKYANTRTRAQAAFMSGIIHYGLGRIDEALAYLQKADLYMKSVNDPFLRGKVLRNLGVTYHTAALRMKVDTEDKKTTREEHLKEAERYLSESISEFEKLLQFYKDQSVESVDTFPSTLFTDVEAEIAITEGVLGMLEYERGKASGRTRIEKAAERHTRLGAQYETYLVANLIRLMRVSPISVRFDLYDSQVHDLTSRSSPARGLRRTAQIALFKTSNRRHQEALERIDNG